MSLFFYSGKKTFLHSMDPRIKFLFLVLLSVLPMLYESVTSQLVSLALVLALFAMAKSFDSLRKTCKLFILIGSMNFLLWVFFYRVGISAPHDILEPARFLFATAMALRFIALLSAGLFFLSITPVEEVSNGLLLLGAPYGVAFAVSLSFRLVITFIQTGFTIVEAQKMRGNDVTKGGLMKRIGAYAPLIIPLVINGIRKAETLVLALESKGFSPSKKPDMKGRYSLKPSDLAAGAAIFFAAAAAAALKIYGIKI